MAMILLQDGNSIQAATTYATLTNSLYERNFNGGSTYVIDGDKNGFVKSTNGTITYYVYNQNGTKDTLANRNNESNPTADGTLTEAGVISFGLKAYSASGNSSYGWLYSKHSYTNGNYTGTTTTSGKSTGTLDFDFQQILEKGSSATYRLEVIFGAGTYKAYGPFRTYSYTTLSGSNNTANIYKCNNQNGNTGAYKIGPLFINVDNRNSSSLGYNGSVGFHLSGINFYMDNNRCSILQAAHASYYTVDNCNFTNGYRGHVIEMTAIQNGSISNCTFTNVNSRLNSSDTSIKGYECIQLESDSAVYRTEENLTYQQGSKSFVSCELSHDGTASSNISVTGCTFNGVIRGVGSHISYKYATNYNNSITVIGNSFSNYQDYAVYFLSTSNLNVSNNYFDGSGVGTLYYND